MERRWLVYPYHLWMLMFTVAPLALIFYFAFTVPGGAGSGGFTLDNIRQAAEPLYLRDIPSGWRRWPRWAVFSSAIPWQ